MFEDMLKYKYKRFDSYESFLAKANQAEDFNWHLHSWQDTSPIAGPLIDIRAIFVSPYVNPKVFPE